MHETEMAIIGAIASFGVFTGGLAWFVSSQFSQLRKNMWTAIADLQNAMTVSLDIHKKDDAQNFQRIDRQLWMIRLRNAVRDGVTISEVVKELPEGGDGGDS